MDSFSAISSLSDTESCLATLAPDSDVYSLFVGRKLGVCQAISQCVHAEFCRGSSDGCSANYAARWAIDRGLPTARIISETAEPYLDGTGPLIIEPFVFELGLEEDSEIVLHLAEI